MVGIGKLASRWLSALVFVGWTCLPLASAQAHPDHVAIAEVEHVAARHTLEVSLRCKPEDLEQAIFLQLGRQVELESAEGEAAAAAYVVQNLRFLKADGSALAPTWVGYEVTPAYAWLYFEVALPSKRWRPIDVAFYFLMELAPEQQNTVLFRRGEQRSTLLFVFGDRTHRLPEPPRKPIRKPD